MKRILLSTALVLGTAGFATAQDTQLRELVSQELTEYGYGPDVSVEQLSDEQVTQLYFIATSTDSSSVKKDRYDRVLAEFEDDGQPRSLVRLFAPMEGDTDATPVAVDMPRNQLRSLVDQMLESFGRDDVDVSELSNDQLAALYLIDLGSESESEQETSIDAILNNNM